MVGGGRAEPLNVRIWSDVAIWSSVFMAAISSGLLMASGWATTLDRQHALAAALTSANGLAILILASAAGILPATAWAL